MKRLLIPALTGLAMASPAKSEEKALIVSPPVLNAMSGDGWHGYVHISAHPCAEQARIDVILSFSNVKDGSDALEKLKPQIEKAEAEARKISAECEHHKH